ncbi:MAG: hypothetical protein IJX17_05195 [Clostridia bacterium]|nr:hypothetical protein [Clostridia bacterium]
MAEAAVAQRKPFKVVGILPQKLQDKLAEMSDNRAMDQILNEVYDEMGIHNIKSLIKDFQGLVQRQENPADRKLADSYYENKEISDFASRCLKADKRSAREKLLKFGGALGVFAITNANPAIHAAYLTIYGAVKAIIAAYPVLSISALALSTFIYIRRSRKSQRGNYFDGHAKREATDQELLELVAKLESVKNELESRKNEFLNARKTMPKKEYLAWMKQEVKHIVAKAGGVIEMNDLGNISDITDPNVKEEPVVKEEPKEPVVKEEPIKPVKSEEEPKKTEPTEEAGLSL